MRHIWSICFQLDIFSLQNLKQKEKEKTGHQELIICHYDIIHFDLLPDGLEKEN